MKLKALDQDLISTQLDFSISFEVEYTLAKLFTEEIRLIQSLQLVNSELSKRYDFNAVTFFSFLDNDELGHIESDKYNIIIIINISFERFLVKYEMELNKNDLEAICRRFDINKNQVITLKQVRTLVSTEPLFSTLNPKNYSRGTMSSPRKKKLEEKKPFETQFRQLYHSPNKSKVGREYKEIYPTNYIYISPKTNTDIIGGLSPKRESHQFKKTVEIVERLSPKKKTKDNQKEYDELEDNLQHGEEEHFLNFLTDLIRCENGIERTKCDLAIKSDFNLQDAFRLFETENKGFFTQTDFKSGCNFLEIFPTDDEIKLIFKRFTNGGEIIIRYYLVLINI